MAYLEHRRPTNNIKTIEINKIQGLPENAKCKFKSIELRFYRNTEDRYIFSCGVRIPKHYDEEGYPLELEISKFSTKLDSEAYLDDLEIFDNYEATLNSFEFEDLPKYTTCFFEEREQENGEKYIILRICVKSTAFNGYAYLEDLYTYETDEA